MSRRSSTLDATIAADMAKMREIVKPDVVNHPPHYVSHPSGIECIDIVEHMGFTLGNVIKYVWRADLKNGLEDLQKAMWYLQREIDKRTKKASKP